MSDSMTFHSATKFVEFFQVICIVITLGGGVAILLDKAIKSFFSKYDNQNTPKTFFISLFIGFLQEVFFSINWMWKTSNLCSFDIFMKDMYSLPVVCFVSTFAVITISESSILRSTTRKFVYVTYISTALLFIIGTRTIFILCYYGNNFAHIFGGCDMSFSNSLYNQINITMTSFVCEYCSPASCYALEYTLIYIPSTAILFYNIKDILEIFKQNWQINKSGTTQEKEKHDMNDMTQKCILLIFLLVIWIIRPVSWILDLCYSLTSDDLIPSMTVLILYIFLLWYLSQQMCLPSSENERNSDHYTPLKYTVESPLSK
ncbi:uncharacterized protein LOC127718281 [Mytilus californianus]|uniref:uncharacterized protein LOC127718281 n=1 Tax=Mytilus californianus TaxID=6549 RepID=UPI00224548C0|nr:uncharacterized protein LOC127718281 [Mytilus californianus]XP_052080241.1 uncharacterized protein LOC127718281 [Mytilus californianus]XP_052080242.1 uncharacterized protein LOC127718281 [Mytilus californianus]XP_052080243.1 uncharacterized protein LOC127718281 [Mytilus californianus]